MARRGQLELRIRTWGGRRAGAGRRPAEGRRHVPHRRREPHDPRCPLHVTMRARPGLPSLRGNRVFAAVRGALRAGSRKPFRIIEFSVQADHVHLIVGADRNALVLVRGLQGLAIRVAKAINRALGRVGRVWGDRYHARLLRRPREVRHALVYVLQNWRKHLKTVRGFDPCWSAAWFGGWRQSVALASVPSPVAMPHTWLVTVGWRRHGLIGCDEAPARPRGIHDRQATPTSPRRPGGTEAHRTRFTARRRPCRRWRRKIP